jgi:hypothetical protein
LLFGYQRKALAQLDELRARPAASNRYTRAWIDHDRAEALLALGEIDSARRLIEKTLAYFHSLGDIRREAAVLALQARAAALSDDGDAAFEGYRRSLARYREIRYAAAREQALYDLRIWRRRVDHGPLAERIDALLDAEPEKRYVARFPSSLQPYLQVLSVAALPLAFLLAAIAAPTTVVQKIAGGQPLSLQTFYDLRVILAVIVLLLPLYLLAYTLVALVVIFFGPRGAVEREQPDYVVTDPLGITGYNARGAMAQRIDWREVRRWISADRRIWARPAALFSQTFLEAGDRRKLQIDGITGWYVYLQRDIAYHLGTADNPTREEDMGFRVLHSPSGFVMLVGLVLLLVFISSANNWSQWLLALLSTPVYAALATLAFSCALLFGTLAYWVATQPLAVIRTLGLRDAWPYFVGVAGVVAIVIYLLTDQPHKVFYISLLVWGCYVTAEAIYTIALPRWRTLGRMLTIAAPLLAVVITFPEISLDYLLAVNQNGANQAAIAADVNPSAAVAGAQVSLNSAQAIVSSTRAATKAKAEAALNSGRALAAVGRYDQAIQAYDASLEFYQEFWRQQRLAPDPQVVGTISYNRAAALKASGQPWEAQYEAACRVYPANCEQAPLK